MGTTTGSGLIWSADARKTVQFKRNNDKGGFHWTAESEIERTGFHRGFTAVGVQKLGTVAVVPFGLTVSPESQDVAVNGMNQGNDA
jgi:hypothetical protein